MEHALFGGRVIFCLGMNEFRIKDFDRNDPIKKLMY